MADPVIAVNDVGQVAIGACDVEHDTTFPFGGGDALLAGTILARHTGTGAWQLYVKGGATNGNGIGGGVLQYAVTATGDVAVDVVVRGTVNQDRLIIDADQSGANVDYAVVDTLRSNGILAKPVTQLAMEDNQ